VSRWVALLLAVVGGAIAAYTTILLVAGGLLGVGWLWVFGDDPWPSWAMTGLHRLIPIGGLVLWALFGGLIWVSLRRHRRPP
jgi:hypothetical protein